MCPVAQAKSSAPGVTPGEAWNLCTINLAETARSHLYYFMLVKFADIVARCETNCRLQPHS